MKARLPDDLRFGAVALAVTDLERSIDYYRRRLGLDLLERQGTRATLGVGQRRLLELDERRGAARDPQAVDLFHFALRVPSRPALVVVGRRENDAIERRAVGLVARVAR